MSDSNTTTNHSTIKKWAEERNGKPSIVEATEKNRSGLLRIDFNEKEEGLKEISWDKFFEIFDENDLAFLYQEETNGSKSRFFKIIDKE